MRAGSIQTTYLARRDARAAEEPGAPRPVPVSVTFRFNVARDELLSLTERAEWKADVAAANVAALAANVILLRPTDGFEVIVDVPDEVVNP